MGQRFPVRDSTSAGGNVQQRGQNKFPFASLHASEHFDRITASLWGKSMDDLDEHQAIEMAYRRTVSADLFPRAHSNRLDETETKIGFPAYISWQTAGFPDPIPINVLQEHDIYVTKVMNRVCTEFSVKFE